MTPRLEASCPNQPLKSSSQTCEVRAGQLLLQSEDRVLRSMRRSGPVMSCDNACGHDKNMES